MIFRLYVLLDVLCPARVFLYVYMQSYLGINCFVGTLVEEGSGSRRYKQITKDQDCQDNILQCG